MKKRKSKKKGLKFLQKKKTYHNGEPGIDSQLNPSMNDSQIGGAESIVMKVSQPS